MEWTLLIGIYLSRNAMLLPKLLSMDYKMPYFAVSLPHRIASDQGIHFIVNKMQQWAHTQGIH